MQGEERESDLMSGFPQEWKIILFCGGGNNSP